MAEETTKDETKELAPASLTMTKAGFAPTNMEEAWRYATALAQSRSGLVPKAYQGKPGECLIAIELAMQLRVPPTQYMQQTYPVHGRIGMMAQLAISLVNRSGLYIGHLHYEHTGDDPAKQDYRIRAWAVDKETGEKVYGPWIDWPLAKAEGWLSKSDSKWKTMPAKMFIYRAGKWFADVNCPQVLMGMSTVDELTDVGPTGLEGGRKSISSETIAGPTPTTERTAFGKEAEPAKDVAEPKPDTTEDDGAKDGPGEEVEQKPLNKNIDPEGTPTHVCNNCGAIFARAVDECTSCGKNSVVPINAEPQKGGQS